VLDLGTRHAIVLVWLGAAPLLRAQAPDSFRVANPERPTFATHAYAVAPRYLELEQGIRAQGEKELRDETAWDENVKYGLVRNVQLALSAPLYDRTGAGTSEGDLQVTLKLHRDLSPHVAAALVPSITLPTGNSAEGHGAGEAEGGVLAVVSADLPKNFHVDVNLGPTGIGGGVPQWFHSLSASWQVDRCTIEGEWYGFTAGNGADASWGVLGALAIRLAYWAVLDVGGSIGYWRETPDIALLGLTVNVGRL